MSLTLPVVRCMIQREDERKAMGNLSAQPLPLCFLPGEGHTLEVLLRRKGQLEFGAN